MQSIHIKKQITTVTTWINDEQKQKIEHESDSATFYFWFDGKIAASFDQKDATDILKKCDALISAGFNEMDLSGQNYIPNNAFLSIVLSQFLHVPKVDTIHNNSNHN
jgi:hypothetical protein